MTFDPQLSRRAAMALMTGAAGTALFGNATAWSLPTAESGTGTGTPSDLHFEISHRFRPVDLLPRGAGPVRHEPDDRSRGAGAVDVRSHRARPGGTVGLGHRGRAENRRGRRGERRAGDTTGRRGPGPLRQRSSTACPWRSCSRAGPARSPRRRSASAYPSGSRASSPGDAVGAFSAGGGRESIGRPWEPLVTDQGRLADVMDLHRPALLARMRYAFGAQHAEVERVQAGPFGQLGLRDLCLVRNADGTPHVREGFLYFTTTCSGVGYVHQAHTGVWRMDPSRPESVEQVGKHFFSYQGLLVGNHGGQLVHDGQRGRFIVLTCGGNLPTPGVTVRHAATTADLLSGVHLVEVQRLAVPFTHAAWDPALRLIDGRWHYAYVDVTDFQPSLRFRPVLAAADGDYSERIAVRCRDTDSPNNNEGCRLQQCGDRWYLLTSDPEARRYPIRDLAMRPRDALDAPYPLGTPFPEVFPWHGPDGGPEWMVVTSDETTYEPTSAHQVLGYGVHGDVIVMHAD